jgi:hypothetical protein
MRQRAIRLPIGCNDLRHKTAACLPYEGSANTLGNHREWTAAAPAQ